MGSGWCSKRSRSSAVQQMGVVREPGVNKNWQRASKVSYGQHQLVCLKMDTIRRKMYLLKAETAEMLAKMRSVETEMGEATTAVKEREKKLRDLCKNVSGKENQLDKLTEKLESSEKKLKLKAQMLEQSLQEADQLKQLIADKEAQLKKLTEKAEQVSCHLLASSSRADKSEKWRKEVEHRCTHHQDTIDKQQADLALAKKTTMETYEKYDETVKKVAIKEKKLDEAGVQLASTERRVAQLEQKLNQMAITLGDKHMHREIQAKREEALKRQAAQLEKVLQEADSRSQLMEDEAHKLNLICQHLQQEQQALVRMAKARAAGNDDSHHQT